MSKAGSILTLVLVCVVSAGCDDVEPSELLEDAAVVEDASVGSCPALIDVEGNETDERLNGGSDETFGGKVYRLKVGPAAQLWDGTVLFEILLAATGQEAWFGVPDPANVPPCAFNLMGDGARLLSCGGRADSFTVGAAGELPGRQPAKENRIYDYVFILSQNFDILGEYNAGVPTAEEVNRCRVGCRQDFACNTVDGSVLDGEFGLTWDLQNVVTNGDSRTDVFVNRVDLDTNVVY